MARSKKKPVSKRITNTVAKYNYRLKAMGEQGVDVEYIKGKFEKANIPLTKSGNISTRGLTEQNIHALEAILPEMKSKGEYDYTDFAKQIEEEKSYNERRLAELQQQVAILNYKDAMKQRVEEMLSEYYGSDKKNKRQGASYENNINYKKMSDEHQIKFSEEIVEVGTAVANGTMTEEQFEEYLDKWASWAGIGNREAYQ